MVVCTTLGLTFDREVSPRRAPAAAIGGAPCGCAPSVVCGWTGTSVGHRWELLCGQTSEIGPGTSDTQYWVANVDPSGRYVLSLPGSDR